MKSNVVQEKSEILDDLTVIRSIKTKSSQLEMKKVAAYCRVSKDVDSQVTSIETQMGSFKLIISEHPDWELARIYADQGSTGTNVDRPDFQKMITDAREGKIDMILAKSLSRFSRNTVDLLSITRELRNIGVGVYFEKEKINTLNQQSEMLLTVYAAFAQEESHSISENMKHGIRERFRLGIPKWAEIYGLVRVRKDEWGIDEEKANVIRDIFDLYIQGKTQRQIADYLNEKGIKGPNKRNKDSPWYQYGVSEIIRNEKYIGDCLMQKYYTKDHLSHRRVKNSQSVVDQFYKENHHPAIVDKEVYNDANLILLMRDMRRGGTQYPYFGRLICPFCGAPMVRATLPTGERRKVWICGGKGKSHLYTDRTDCPSYWLREPCLTNSIREAILNEEGKNLTEKNAAALAEIQTELKKRNTIEFIDLRHLVKSITFPNWKTIEITWNWGAKSQAPYLMKSAIEYPMLTDHETWKSVQPIIKNIRQVEDAAKRFDEAIKRICIIPDETKRFLAPPFVFKNEEEMYKRMGRENFE